MGFWDKVGKFLDDHMDFAEAGMGNTRAKSLLDDSRNRYEAKKRLESMALHSNEMQLRYLIIGLEGLAEREPPERSDLAAELAEHAKTLEPGIS